MNKYALNILKFAYSQYQNSNSDSCSVQLSGNADDIVALRNALRNLESDGYIGNVFYDGLLITFDLSAIGVEYMRGNGKF